MINAKYIFRSPMQFHHSIIYPGTIKQSYQHIRSSKMGFTAGKNFVFGLVAEGPDFGLGDEMRP